MGGPFLRSGGSKARLRAAQRNCLDAEGACDPEARWRKGKVFKEQKSDPLAVWAGGSEGI